MKDKKTYWDKKLKLPDLAQMADINTNGLSQLFNTYYASSFYEFINAYRLEDVTTLLVHPDNEK